MIFSDFFYWIVLSYWWALIILAFAVALLFWRWKKDVQRVYPILTISLAALAFIITVFGTAYANRPYLGVKDVVFLHPGGDSISSWFVMENFGKSPALEARPVNFRAILLRYSGDRAITPQFLDDPKITQDEKGARLAERSQQRVAILEVLHDYFNRNPTANRDTVSAYFNNLRVTPALLGRWQSRLVDNKGQFVFQLIECNPDLHEYFRRGTAIFPGTEASRLQQYNNQMGQDGINHLISGDNLLALLWVVDYETPFPGQGTRRTFSLSSYDALLMPKPGTLPFFYTQNKEMAFLLTRTPATTFSLDEHRVWTNDLLNLGCLKIWLVILWMVGILSPFFLVPKKPTCTTIDDD